jgi:hypothetical protein
MSVSNTIFNSNFSKQTIPQIERLDNGQMSGTEEVYFNTYRHWKPFDVPMQKVITGRKDSEGKAETAQVTAKGTKSLFNNYNAVYTDENFRIDANMPLLDTPDNRQSQREKTACTIQDLVKASASGLMGRQIYNYSDFAYCKYLGKIPNNYLITLRRFGTPCGDKIDLRTYPSIKKLDEEAQQHMPDIGRLITWIGTPGNEMSNILKYSYQMQWEDIEAKIDEVEAKGDETGKLASIFNMTNSNYRQQVMQGFAGKNFAGKKFIDGLLGNLGSGATDPPYDKSQWDRMYDSTKVYGPIDVIDKTKRRKRGLVFEQKFSLTFDYELRSYYGVNGKAAMMDLLANILATTYTHGTFWGGERRFVGAAQDNIFANLPIFKLSNNGGMNNPYSIIESFINTYERGSQAVTNGFEGETTQNKIENFAKDLGGMVLGGMLNKLGRPNKYALASLISGAPVGCWHLTIGNPRSPIIEVGNLVCTGSEIEHYGPLGLDDFPTGIRVKINLEHGKPRDIMGIEQMYGRGDCRIYSPLGNEVMSMYKLSEPVKISRPSGTGMLQTSLDEMLLPHTQQTKKKQDIEIKDAEEFEIKYLKRYFGTLDESMIASAGGESLYGSENNKNKHVAK